MKNLIIQVSTLFFILCTFTTICSAQIDNVLSQRVVLTSAALESRGYTIVDSDADYIQEGRGDIYKYTLYSNSDYVIIAVGGSGIRDLDLYLYDSDGNLATKDTDCQDDGLAMIDYSTSRYSENTYIKVKNHDSKRKRKQYQMAIIIAVKKTHDGLTSKI